MRAHHGNAGAVIWDDVGVVCDGGDAEIVIGICGVKTACAENECEDPSFHMAQSIND